jgi:hypothetical protein
MTAQSEWVVVFPRWFLYPHFFPLRAPLATPLWSFFGFFVLMKHVPAQLQGIGFDIALH